MNNTELLGTDELMHLALDATNRSLNGQAIEYLKRLLLIEPANAEALYLLGAQQAQVGLFERGIESMGRAVDLKPELHAARFQLGLLLATSSRIDEAEKAWRPLDALGEANPFVLFKTGVLHIARDQFEQAVNCLERGIQANTSNAPLNEEMALLVAKVRTDHADALAKSGEPVAKTAADVPPMFLDAYKTGKVH